MENGMARYKHIDTSPRLLPVDLTRQSLPGTFEPPALAAGASDPWTVNRQRTPARCVVGSSGRHYGELTQTKLHRMKTATTNANHAHLDLWSWPSRSG